MADLRDRIEDLIKEFKWERDELSIKIGLAKIEAGAKDVRAATAEASKDVGATAPLLSHEIRKGLKPITYKL